MVIAAESVRTSEGREKDKKAASAVDGMASSTVVLNRNIVAASAVGLKRRCWGVRLMGSK